MDLHDDFDYDDDTALELAHPLDNLEMADLVDECNIVAPEDGVET